MEMNLMRAIHNVKKVVPRPRNVRKQIRAAKQMTHTDNLIILESAYSELLKIDIEQEMLSWLKRGGCRLSARDAHAWRRAKERVAAHE